MPKPTIEFPIDAMAQHGAIIGKVGSGKSYTARGLVEKLLDAGRRVCIIDPTGVWYGIKANAKGTGPGYSVAVFGGDHADVPLTVAAARPLGEMLGKSNLPAVIDVSGFTMADRYRFAEGFFSALHQYNRAPLNLVVDEADEFARQNPVSLEQTMALYEIDRIVRRGRVRGFRVTLITQRPAVIHKNVLTQANTMVAMRLTGPQDRKAIEEWIKGNADEAKGKEVLGSLASLPRGHGWVWAPELDILGIVAFPRIKTYDSMKAPEEGDEIREPINLADVDLTTINKTLEEAVHTAKANDPAALKKRIAELEAEIRRKQPATPLVPYEKQLQAEFAKGQMQGVRDGKRAAYDKAAQEVIGPFVSKVVDLATDMARRWNQDVEKIAPPAATVPYKRPETKPTPVQASNGDDGSLHAAARAMLKVLAERWPSKFSWGQTATLAGLKARGGHYNAGAKQLRDERLVLEENGLIEASDTGKLRIGIIETTPLTPTEVLSMWCAKLPAPAPEILRALVSNGELETEDLARAIGKKPIGGHWNNGMKVLRDNGLIEKSRSGWRASILLGGTA